MSPAAGTTTPVDWPTRFPHAEIEGLLERLAAGSADEEDAAALLRAVALEAQRLRSAVARLSAERLRAAEEEAAAVLVRAHAQADELRRGGYRALESRLDEADELSRAVRRSFRVDDRLRGARASRTDGDALPPEDGGPA